MWSRATAGWDLRWHTLLILMLDKTIGHAALLLMLLLSLAAQSGFKHCPLFQGWYVTKLAGSEEEKDHG